MTEQELNVRNFHENIKVSVIIVNIIYKLMTPEKKLKVALNHFHRF